MQFFIRTEKINFKARSKLQNQFQSLKITLKPLSSVQNQFQAWILTFNDAVV